MLTYKARPLTGLYSLSTLPVLNEREDMDQTTAKQPTGKVKANFVRILPHDPKFAGMSPAERAANAKLPLFRGTISAPENPDDLFEYAVWDYPGKNGKPFLAGPVRPLSTRATVQDHLVAAQLSAADAKAIDEAHDATTGELRDGFKPLNPHTIVLRLVNAKILKTDERFATLSTKESAENDARPLYWAKWQRDAGTPEVRASLWDKAGRYGAFLDGRTQYPLTREQVAALDRNDEPAFAPEPVVERAAGRRTRRADESRGR